MSTRSRLNPWFRPVAPLAEMYLDGVIKDAAFELRLRPTVEPKPANYDEHSRTIVHMLMRSRLDNKLVLTARLLDPMFDARVRALCPELPELVP